MEYFHISVATIALTVIAAKTANHIAVRQFQRREAAGLPPIVRKLNVFEKIYFLMYADIGSVIRHKIAGCRARKRAASMQPKYMYAIRRVSDGKLLNLYEIEAMMKERKMKNDLEMAN